MYRLLLSITIVALLVGVGCGKKAKDKDKDKSPSKEVQTSTDAVKAKSVNPKLTPKNPIKKPGVDAVKSISLSQIPVCDKYVSFVCACAKKHPDSYQMTQACKLAKATYPQWKRGSAKSREEQETIIKACSKSILIIKSNNMCNDVK
jgi:hypothetical protein